MAVSPALADAKVLLLQKEQEVAGLREAALKQLEAQVQHGQHEYRNSKKLQADGGGRPANLT